jgi:predicted dehydrogenase
MAVSVAECDQMITACRDAGRQLAIGYRLHFEPYNLELMRLAREKVLGAAKVVEASAGFRIGDPRQWRLDRKLSGGGSLMDIGIYARDKYYFNYKNPKFNEVIAKAEATIDDAERAKVYAEAQKILADDVPALFLYVLPKLGVWNAKLDGLWKNEPIPSNDITEVHWND